MARPTRISRALLLAVVTTSVFSTLVVCMQIQPIEGNVDAKKGGIPGLTIGRLRKLLHAGHSHEEEDTSGDYAYGGETQEPVNLQDKDLVANKGASMAVFFLVPFIGVWIPFFFPVNNELLKYGLLFASGLFFSLALEHLVNDSASGFAYLSGSDYPFAYLLVVCGYMLTWLTDIIVHAIWERKAERDAVLRSQIVTPDKEPLKCCKKPTDADEEEKTLQKQTNKCSGQNCNCNGDDCKCSSSGLEYSEHQEVLRAGAAVNAALIRGDKKKTKDLNEFGAHELSLADLALLLLAMCFHAVFEGLAVGLSSSVSDVWQNALTIVLHKFFEGMALGAALKAQDLNRSWVSVFLYGSFFSIMAPVGIAIGIALDTSVASRTSSWVDTIGNGIAAGVFIFVSVTHLMVKGFKKGPNDRWWTPFIKWGACVLGAVTLSLLQLRH